MLLLLCHLACAGARLADTGVLERYGLAAALMSFEAAIADRCYSQTHCTKLFAHGLDALLRIAGTLPRAKSLLTRRRTYIFTPRATFLFFAYLCSDRHDIC